MNLPKDNHSLLKEFTIFLKESGLSSVSVKNYISDIRNFFTFLELNGSPDLQNLYLNISKYNKEYQNNQRDVFTPANTINRRLASIRRLTTYLKVTYFTGHDTLVEQIDHNTSLLSTTSDTLNSDTTRNNQPTSSQKIIDQFQNYLKSEKKTHSTIKNYCSDLYHYFNWIAKHTPFNTHHLNQVLSKEQLTNYVSYLKLSQTTSSVINRRQSSVKRLTHFCYKQGFVDTNPFEYVQPDAKLSPLSWFVRRLPKPKSPSNTPKSRFAKAYFNYHQLPFTPYLHLAILVIATTTMGLLAYNQIIKNARPSSAATSLTPPKRQLSFQGRLSDSSGTPIVTTVNVNFKLWDSLTLGSQLYTTGTCSVTPDSQGIFNSLIGDGVCGSEIPMSVFSDNRDIYLEVGVGAETLTPRQQIATVGYALNSETLQGYPASSAATINTVPVIDNNGDINIAVASPSIISTSGNFSIVGQSLSLTTATNSGGDIVLQPDALGSGQILAIGGTTTEDTFRITNANLTTGSLVSGYIGNDVATGSGNLLLLSSGATETAKFRVTADGRTTITTATASAITAALTVDQNSTGDIFTSSASGITKFNIGNSGSINTIDGVAHTIDDVTGNLTITSNSNTISLNDNVTFTGTTTLNSQTYTWPASGGSNTYVLQTNGSGTLSWTDINTSINTASMWLEANGSIFPKNSTVDFLFGGQATESAKFAVLNVNSGIPVASISSGLSGISSFLTADGTLATTNNQTLTIGNSTTGNISIATGTKSVTINSNTWDISSAGIATGFTGLTSSGTINFSGLYPSSAVYTDGSSNLTSISPTTGILGFWQRTSGVLAPWFISDSINIGATATSSALVHLGGTAGESSFFMEPLAVGFDSSASPITNPGIGGGTTALQVDGDILPGIDDDAFLGRAGTAWNRVYLSNGINNSAGTEQISILNRNLTGGRWNATSTFLVGGDHTATMPTGIEFYTIGDASVSATFTAGGNSRIIGDLNTDGNVVIGGGTGKLDVGTVDPPYTINGQKYATYLSGMIGVKEETTGNIVTNEYIENIGYRKTINFNSEAQGSDLWLFSKTTNLKENLNRMSVLLTPSSQAKTWYEIDKTRNTLYIYSSAPGSISYRLSAPRFDDAKWSNTRTAGVEGFVLNVDDDFVSENNLNENTNYSAQIEKIDGQFALIINNQEKSEIGNFSSSLIANLRSGLAVVSELVTDNLVVKNKLISPIADINELKAINATISGTLTADNIQSKTIDKLNEQLDIINDKYSTASAILASIQERINTPLQQSPLSTISAQLPDDFTNDSLNLQTLYASDILANGSIFTQSLSSFESDLFIQPTGDKPVHILANLLNLYPNGQVVIQGDLLVTGNIFANNIDTRTATISGTLALGTNNSQVSTESGKLLAIFGKQGQEVSSIDASGSANFNTLQTNGLVIASQNGSDSSISGTITSNSTIGTASIATNSAEIFIQNNQVNPQTLIYITPISDTSNQVLYVKSKQACSGEPNCIAGFTVAAPQILNKETSFNYWLVQTK